MPCNPNPCQNEGNCSVIGVTYLCTCPDQYMGRNCTDGRGCFAMGAECLNSGACQQETPGMFRCMCTPNTTGDRCETLITDQCLTDADCQQNATCDTTFDPNRCVCLPGLVGPLCSLLECGAQKPCLNNQTCINPDTTTSQCIPGTDRCLSDPCQNNALCWVLGTSGYRCICRPGYYGSNCEITGFCRLVEPCQNAGICLDHDYHPGDTGYRCVCLPYVGCPSNGRCRPFRGVNCTLEPDHCNLDSCHNAGICVSNRTGFHCNCPLRYAGPHCEVNLCVYGRPLLSSPDVCQCNPGYTGALCDTHLCENNARCANGICASTLGAPGGQCICQAGWQGEFCSDGKFLSI